MNKFMIHFYCSPRNKKKLEQQVGNIIRNWLVWRINKKTRNNRSRNYWILLVLAGAEMMVIMIRTEETVAVVDANLDNRTRDNKTRSHREHHLNVQNPKVTLRMKATAAVSTIGVSTGEPRGSTAGRGSSGTWTVVSVTGRRRSGATCDISFGHVTTIITCDMFAIRTCDIDMV